jgi:hypothetical protein
MFTINFHVVEYYHVGCMIILASELQAKVHKSCELLIGRVIS